MKPRNIWAVGRNYGAHAKEMGAAVPTTPMIFLKSGDTATSEGYVDLPKFSRDVHHEVEIAMRFGSRLDGHGHLLFESLALALDLTARDIQAELKALSHPWTLAKSFIQSCPISQFIPVPDKLPTFDFELKVNGSLRQRGSSRDMIFDFETLRRYVQDRFPVQPGDLLLTGTPEGVAKLSSGDVATAALRSTTGHELTAEWLFR